MSLVAMRAATELFSEKRRHSKWWRWMPWLFNKQDSLAQWSKALASGASPQGRGLEPHSCHAGLQHVSRGCLSAVKCGE